MRIMVVLDKALTHDHVVSLTCKCDFAEVLFEIGDKDEAMVIAEEGVKWCKGRSSLQLYYARFNKLISTN